MGVAELFYSGSKQTDKKQVRIGVDDLELIRKVFPESGVVTSLSVYLFEQIAKALIEAGITSYDDRVKKGLTLEHLKSINIELCKTDKKNTKKNTKKK